MTPTITTLKRSEHYVALDSTSRPSPHPLALKNPEEIENHSGHESNGEITDIWEYFLAIANQTAMSDLMYANARATPQCFYEKALKIMKTGSFQKDGHTFDLFAIPDSMTQHLYSLSIDSAYQLIPERSNREIEIKLFRKEFLEEFKERTDEILLNKLLEKHTELEERKVKVPHIFNKLTASSDGYLIMQKIQPLRFPWNKDTDLSIIDAKRDQILNDIIKIFIYALYDRSSFPLDLSKGNFGVDENSCVYLKEHIPLDDWQEEFAFRRLAKFYALDLANGSSAVLQILENVIQETIDESGNG